MPSTIGTSAATREQNGAIGRVIREDLSFSIKIDMEKDLPKGVPQRRPIVTFWSRRREAVPRFYSTFEVKSGKARFLARKVRDVKLIIKKLDSGPGSRVTTTNLMDPEPGFRMTGYGEKMTHNDETLDSVQDDELRGNKIIISEDTDTLRHPQRHRE